MIETRFMWLEITGRCQLACTHCYADSGPDATHGTMTTGDWTRVIDEGTALGVSMVQVIGGEPTLHPALPTIVEHARNQDLRVEVYSNLVHVAPTLWEVFSRSGMSLATSWYSDNADEHTAITRRPTHARTRANIVEALRREIPIRVGIIDALDGQRVEQAHAELEALGVSDIGTDRLRRVGRGSDGSPDVSELCGHCGDGRAAVLADGGVFPCVMSRWMAPAGNVREHALADILHGPDMATLRAAVPLPTAICPPDKTGCKPKSGDGGDCQPAEKPACRPKY